MQRVMTLVGTKRYAYKFDDGRTATGTRCYFEYDDGEAIGLCTYSGNLSDNDSQHTQITVGDRYVVTTDREQGKLYGIYKI